MIEPPSRRRALLALAILLVAGTIYAIEHTGPKSSVPAPPADLPVAESGLQGAADFAGATGWLNTPGNQSLDLVGLRGKVVLVDFWTYSCINCIHTLPHVTKLYDTYAPFGLVVVGVHSPEFGFEKSRSNVAAALPRYGIHYPVAQDNSFAVWEAYHNHYWPADYLVDQYGKVRSTHAGEGDYAETEQKVRALLTEAGVTGLPAPIEGAEANVAGHSPELYVAHGESAIGNPEGYQDHANVTYPEPTARDRDRIYLGGAWHEDDDSVTALADAKVWVRFTGAGANVVAGGPVGACVEVWLDGKPLPASLAPKDVTPGDGRSCLVLDGTRSYDLYAGPSAGHELELRVPAGFTLFTFDFS